MIKIILAVIDLNNRNILVDKFNGFPLQLRYGDGKLLEDCIVESFSKLGVFKATPTLKLHSDSIVAVEFTSKVYPDFSLYRWEPLDKVSLDGISLARLIR